MMNVSIIALAKLKESYMREFSSEYEKRLSAFCRLNIIELSPEKLSDNPSESEIQNALSKEAKLIKSKLTQNAYIFSMCIEGKQLSSPEFSKKLDSIALSGKSNLVFIIGSSFGLADEIKELSNFKFSMSKMTFPHQFARCMLLEQIYRGYQISSGGKYHK